MSFCKIRKGSLSSWAISIYSLSGSNLQLADNQRKADSARASAESGLEIVRLWAGNASIPSDVPASLWYYQLGDSFESAAFEISNISIYDDGSTLTIPSVTLDSAEGQSFSAEIAQVDSNTLQATVTGMHGLVPKTIRVQYDFGMKKDTIFDYGVATKGPLWVTGGATVDSNDATESNVFIEGTGGNEALYMSGTSGIAGDITIANPDGYANIDGGNASIGGETPPEAYDHVSAGQSPPDFPPPNPFIFEPYAVGDVINPGTVLTAGTYDNIKIKKNANPIFAGDVTLRGIVYIEAPNIVVFDAKAKIIGMIVGAGDWTDNSKTNQINFAGQVESYPVTDLPLEPQFDAIRLQTGTFILAPGFYLSFAGGFSALNGAIAGNGIEFTGSGGGTINGTVINYSDEPMLLGGNSPIYFNRSGDTEIPAGFVASIVLHYNPDSYSEIVL
ncbi:MAG: hypothetical protein ACYS76_12030 [Planctomycetota bacterium]|jgi:hypothetical protein